MPKLREHCRNSRRDQHGADSRQQRGRRDQRDDVLAVQWRVDQEQQQ